MCPYCSNSCILFGKSSNGNQHYRCKDCKRTHSKSYAYKASDSGINVSIKEHVKEGCGMRSIARLLKISVTTVLKRILSISKAVVKPMIVFGKEYELVSHVLNGSHNRTLYWEYAGRRMGYRSENYS